MSYPRFLFNCAFSDMSDGGKGKMLYCQAPSPCKQPWRVSNEEVLNNNYNLAFKNPNKGKGKEYRPPIEIIASIMEKEDDKSVLMQEVSSHLEKKSIDHQNKQIRWPIVKLGEILTERTEKPNLDAILKGEIPIVAKIGFSTGKIELREESKTRTNMILIKPGDLVISGINVAKRAVAIYGTNNTTPTAATIHYSSYDINNEKADPIYLWHFMRNDNFKRILKNSMKDGIKTEVKPNRFLSIEIPLPSLKEQKRIVSVLKKVDELKKLQAEVEKETEKLTPSILDKAFRGEL